MNPITQHWKGRLGTLGTLAALILPRVLLWPIIETTTGAALITLFGLSLLLLIWQTIGTIRAADIAMSDARTGAAALLYAVLLIVAILSVEQILRRAAGTYDAPPPDTTSLPQILPVTDGTLTLTGPINLRMFANVEATLAATPVTRITLTSEGGSIPAARGLARLITENRIATHAIGPCNSACTLVFIAGTPRSLAPSASLGFHSYGAAHSNKTGKAMLNDTSAELARDIAWIIARGVSPTFANRIATIPHDRLWTPTPAELRAAGVVSR